jgi:hypothetical protein
MWTWDVCKVRQFETFEDAVEHEGVCTRGGEGEVTVGGWEEGAGEGLPAGPRGELQDCRAVASPPPLLSTTAGEGLTDGGGGGGAVAIAAGVANAAAVGVRARSASASTAGKKRGRPFGGRNNEVVKRQRLAEITEHDSKNTPPRSNHKDIKYGDMGCKMHNKHGQMFVIAPLDGIPFLTSFSNDSSKLLPSAVRLSLQLFELFTLSLELMKSAKMNGSPLSVGIRCRGCIADRNGCCFIRLSSAGSMFRELHIMVTKHLVGCSYMLAKDAKVIQEWMVADHKPILDFCTWIARLYGMEVLSSGGADSCVVWGSSQKVPAGYCSPAEINIRLVLGGPAAAVATKAAANVAATASLASAAAATAVATAAVGVVPQGEHAPREEKVDAQYECPAGILCKSPTPNQDASGNASNALPESVTDAGDSKTPATPAMTATSRLPHASHSYSSHPSSKELDPSSLHRFLVSEDGIVGISLTKLAHGKCFISTVHPHSIVELHGIEEGNEILAPRYTSGRMKHPDIYNLFINASKHRPLLFEVKRSYTPPIHPDINTLKGHYSLHRFTITELGDLGIILEIEKSTLCLKSVVPNSLGEFYGLRNNDILCKPLIKGEFEEDDKSLSKAKCPLTIEVWRALPTSNRVLTTSIRMQKSKSGGSNPFNVGVNKIAGYDDERDKREEEKDALSDAAHNKSDIMKEDNDPAAQGEEDASGD